MIGGRYLAEALAIENGTQLHEWLRDRPRKWADDMELRAALRVLPLVLEIFRTSGEEFEPDIQMSIALGGFRTAVTAWASQVFPNSISGRVLLDAAHSAVSAITKPISPTGGTYTTARAAITTISNATIYLARSPSSSDIHGSDTAAEAASLGSIYDGRSDVWEGIRADADWLLGNPSQSLIAQPLWLNDVRRDNRFQVNFPLWARRPFDSFKKSLLVTDGPWGVWLDWYQLILIGEMTGRRVPISAEKSLL
jgi:hypothetical protein